MSRLPVQKTLKLYIGGEFPRSESGRTVPVAGRDGGVVHVSRASRKDLRGAVEKARAAQPGWAKKSAANRGQILYRLGEMLESRSMPTSDADRHAAVDRAIHHAGWTDKIGPLLSSVNPVATTYVNYSMLTPVGVVVAIARAEDGLLGLIEATLPPLVMGNTVIVHVPTGSAELALAFAEAIAVSDVPHGVIALLTGDLAELLDATDHQDDVDTLWIADGAVPDGLVTQSEREAVRMIRRVIRAGPAARPAGPHELARLAEVRTVWMSS